MSDISQLEVEQSVILPVFNRFGIKRGVEIMKIILPTLNSMQEWPQKDREEALVAFLMVIELTKQLASKT